MRHHHGRGVTGYSLTALLAMGVLAGGSPATAAGASIVPVRLPVHVLPTQSAVMSRRWTYPTFVMVRVPAADRGLFAAYGLMGYTLVAPKGWTGSATVGADGSGVAVLHPTVAPGLNRLTLSVIPACIGCALEAAAPYFSWIRAHWARPLGQPGRPPAPLHGEVVPLATGVVAYRVDAPAGRAVNGVALSVQVPGLPPRIWERVPLFTNLLVNLPARDVSWETVMLNAFLAAHPLP